VNAAVEFDHVGFGYRSHGGRVQIADGLDLVVEKGTVTAILGPSGGGKTTLLKLVAGLLGPDRGTVRVFGVDPARNLGQLPVAFSFASNPLLATLTVLENAALPLKLRRIADADERASQALYEVGLGHAGHLLPHELSAGMRVRVGIAAGIALDPDLYLLDEPHGNLDLITRRMVSRTIREGVEALRAKRPVTILLATHAESEALEIADRCIVLDRGRPAAFVGQVELHRASGTGVDSSNGAERLRELHSLLERASRPPVVAVIGSAEESKLPAEVGGVAIAPCEEMEELRDVVPVGIIAVGCIPILPRDLAERTHGRRFAVGEAQNSEWTTVTSVAEGLEHFRVQPERKNGAIKRAFWRRALPYFLLFAVVVVVWCFASYVMKVPRYLLALPDDVVEYAFRHFQPLVHDLAVTGGQAFLGLVCAAAVAVLVGAASDRFRVVDEGLWPVLVSSQVIPLLAIAPLVHIWVPGLPGKILMTTVICFFPLAVGFRSGLRQTTQEEVAMFSLHTRRWWDIFRLLRVPKSLPTACAGLRAAAPVAVIGSILAELAGGEHGLGNNFLLAAKTINSELLFASLFLSSALGLVFYALAAAVERMLVPGYLKGDVLDFGVVR